MSHLIREPVTFQRFLAMGIDDLRCILDELEPRRAKRESGLDGSAIESLIRVMDRAGYTWVLELGTGAAGAWAARVGVKRSATHETLQLSPRF